MSIKPSENVLGADNQQESLDAYWIAGFTDGEGCFAVSVIKNSTTRFGKQIFPEFVITQSAKSLKTLEQIKDYFNCGSLVLNKRYDNHNEHLYRYCVRSISDLKEKIIPFFDRYPLRTYKKNDFDIFKQVVKKMDQKEHLTEIGWLKVLELAGQMNRLKKRN
jgi:hypothetical protein